MAVKDEEQREDVLRRGARGAAVRELQYRLNDLGIAKLTANGTYDPKTEEAVRQFQTRANLPVDGIAGPQTLAALDDLYSSERSNDDGASRGLRADTPVQRPRRPRQRDDTPVPPPLALELRDDAQTLLDRPADLDQLGRLAFARVLAMRLREVRSADVEGPFMLHLHGAWGSGKSSLLRFLERELAAPGPAPDGTRPDAWIVVRFNAWEHQRAAPPWWWLMSSVSSRGQQELARRSKRAWLRFEAADAWWRLRHGWRNLLGVLVGLGVIAIVAWLVSNVVHGTNPGTWMTALAALATPLGAILGVGLTIAAVTRGVRDWLLVRSAAGARNGLARGVDPLATIKSRFKHVVKHLGVPLAVIIDDLDRCQSTYVVELLEGIQTLFADSPVVYVVAADGAWIRDSFEDVYKSFLDMPSEPGRPLGYHFLEKTFQLSADVPRLTARFRRRYFRSLLGVAAEDGSPGSGAATAAAASAESEEEIRSALASARTPEEEAAAVEAALLRAQSTAIRRQTEHRLQDFDPLLELNPRAMKRLVNAYGLARDVEFIEAGGAVAKNGRAPEELALWTILRLRWPLLGVHLEAHPEDVARIGRQTTAKSVPEDLRPLFSDKEVVDVVRGKGVNGRLDESVIRRLTGKVEGGGSTPPPSPPASPA